MELTSIWTIYSIHTEHDVWSGSDDDVYKPELRFKTKQEAEWYAKLHMKGKRFSIESEVVGYNVQRKSYYSFQQPALFVDSITESEFDQAMKKRQEEEDAKLIQRAKNGFSSAELDRLKSLGQL